MGLTPIIPPVRPSLVQATRRFNRACVMYLLFSLLLAEIELSALTGSPGNREVFPLPLPRPPTSDEDNANKRRIETNVGVIILSPTVGENDGQKSNCQHRWMEDVIPSIYPRQR